MHIEHVCVCCDDAHLAARSGNTTRQEESANEVTVIRLAYDRRMLSSLDLSC